MVAFSEFKSEPAIQVRQTNCLALVLFALSHHH